MGSLVFPLCALLAVACFAIGAVRWIERTAAELRGRRLPPMRWL